MTSSDDPPSTPSSGVQVEIDDPSTPSSGVQVEIDDPSTPSSGTRVKIDTSFIATEPLESDLAPLETILSSLPDMTAKVAALGDLEGKPPKPIMGAVIALSKDSWSAWTGGKPKTDWTGLDASAQLETTSPNQLRPVYDKYDKTNDKAARTYLLASLTATLSNKVSEKLEESDPFPIVWLQFLKSIQSTSIERFEDLKTSIKLRLPSQYSGENLELLAAQFRKDALELTTAGQYDHNLTLSMMKNFLLAGGSGNEDFRFHSVRPSSASSKLS
ncbi:hypothetical protein MHU86_25602 [Fragilaria crotonensis]|nr:hypothetical protein MHU86_25602 [Fragilaria crotonensis]